MKISEQFAAEIEPTDVQIAEAESGEDCIQVYRDAKDVYHVIRNGIVSHPHCSAEDALRALGFYLNGVMYKADKAGNCQKRCMQTPPDEGPIKGEAIAARVMQICGCHGQYDCDCVATKNQARRELWTEHNQKASALTP